MRFVLTLLTGAFLLASCHFFAGERVSGNGNVIVLDRHVTNSFDKVDVSGSVKAHVKQDASPSVGIETDQNLMEYIEVFAENGTLVIRTRRGYNLDPSKEIIAYVTAPAFTDIDVSGACDIIGDNPISGSQPLGLHVSGDGKIKMQVDVPKLETDISGSGSINLSGKAIDFNASVSGSGDVKCFDLVTDHTRLDLSGAADAQVTANKTLGVEVSGSGQVQYKGNATLSPEPSISGSGGVKKVD